MEPSTKRRRLSPGSGGTTKAYHFHGDEMVLDEDEGPEPARRILKSRLYGSSSSPKLFADHVPPSPRGSSSRDGKLSALHPRNFVPTRAAGAVQSPAKTVIASVVQVVVNDGNGAEVTELLVPVKTSVIFLEGFAPITLGNNPRPTLSSPNTQGYQNPSPTRPAAASSNAAQTIQVQASRTPSNAASSGSQASSNSLSISVAGAQSQAVLSSPPSTPLPSTPSPSPSPGSTGSYFSSSSIETLASSSAQSAAVTQTTNGQPSPGSGNGNSTTTSKYSLLVRRKAAC